MTEDATPFDCPVDRKGENAILRPRGDLDISSSGEVRNIATALLEEGVHRIAIDLNQVPYLDSTGLGALVVVLKRVRDREGRLCLFAPRDEIRSLLALTGLEGVFHIEPDEASAIDFLASG